MDLKWVSAVEEGSVEGGVVGLQRGRGGGGVERGVKGEGLVGGLRE